MRDTACLTALAIFAALGGCSHAGRHADRLQKTTQSGNLWILEANSKDPKSGKSYEVWKDAETGILWSDALDRVYRQFDAVKLRDDGKVAEETACGPASAEARRATSGLMDRKFGLPTIQEFEVADRHGLREVLPNCKNHWYWTISLNPKIWVDAWLYNANTGYRSFGSRRTALAVRCVSRP